MFRRQLLVLLCFAVAAFPAVGADTKVDYEKQVAPILKKYCAGCHNDTEKEGNFSLESFASLQRGVKTSPAVLPGDPQGSLLWKVLLPGAETAMPPEGEQAPNEAERDLLRLWIEQGASGPKGMEPDRLTLHVPQIASQTSKSPITSLAISPDGKLIAVGRFGKIELRSVTDQPPANWPVVRMLEPLPGKVESLEFNDHGKQLLSASGVTGSGGIATLWNVDDGKRLRDFRGHRDQMLDAVRSPDGQWIATSGYDREIILWNAQTGEKVRTLTGHNGAVYSIAFSPDGKVLASASADDTCKLWRTSDGERLDTLGQPLKEQYTLQFSRDGKTVAAAGADNRLRIWQLTFQDQPGINPLIISRFAHEAPVTTFTYSGDGTRLVTTAEDRTIKVWETQNFTELSLLENQPEIITTIAPDPVHDRVLLGRLDGSLDILPLPPLKSGSAVSGHQTPVAVPVTATGAMQETAESEPNQTPVQAQAITLPAQINGVIHSQTVEPDLDCFRFAAKAGERWVIEINAARSKSELDSFVEVLSETGEPIQRVLLQAVRDSYFTFRGKNSTQTGDFRIFNWEEMALNQFLYCNGEVVKLWQSPTGPDSGFSVYPGERDRWNYFDTSGLSHALGAPCYVVEVHPPGTQLIPNGLPVFPIHYENDDDASREGGKDSKLFFTAPYDGNFVLRIRDVRGNSGEKLTYQAMIRPPAPDFVATLANRKAKVSQGNRVEVQFKLKRKDQFAGPVTIDADQLPPGFSLSTPVIIEPEQVTAFATLAAAVDAQTPTPEQLKAIRLKATATIEAQDVTHPIPPWTEIAVDQKPSLQLAIRPSPQGVQPLPQVAGGPLEFVIHPGETIMLEVAAERNGFTELIAFGKEDSGRNLPHGVFVDNIGLNGLLMPANVSVREFFITAYDWVPEQSRLFHLQTTAQGGRATTPVMIHVRKRENSKADRTSVLNVP